MTHPRASVRPGACKHPIEAELRKPHTIGELELMAGIGPAYAKRLAFWIRYKDVETKQVLPTGVAELK